jgi:GNAT superfamily N-acetyltransferase
MDGSDPRAIDTLDADSVEAAAALVAREHAAATVASARGRGVAGALVEAALDWADRHGFHSVSVDFMPANPLSRPFWLGAGFRCTGYAVARTIPASYGPEARASPGSVPSMLS